MTTTKQATKPRRTGATVKERAPIELARSGGRAALNNNDAAEYIGLAAGTLKKWRVTGEGPAYVRIGSRIVYLVQDLDAWLLEHRVA